MNNIFSTSKDVYDITVGKIPVIFHVPHAGLSLPYTDDNSLSKINGERIDLEDSIKVLADYKADVLLEELSQRSPLLRDSYVFTSKISRLFMDPERFDDDTEEMNKVGMGVVYSKNHHLDELYKTPLSDKEISHRKKLYYHYSVNLQETVESIVQEYGNCLIIDLHSYSKNPLPYEIHKDEKRAELCLGHEDYHSEGIRDSIDRYGKEDWVSLNGVFKGSYVPMNYYLQDKRVQSIMFEIRKDVYMNEQTFELELDNFYINEIKLAIETVIQEFLN